MKKPRSAFLQPPGSSPEDRYGEDSDWYELPAWRKTTFFGIRARGQFFVYVVDCSGSMLDDDRLTRATIEVRRSVLSLEEPQKFEVIFYNNESMPMPGGPRPRTADLQAKNQLLSWLRLIEPDGGTDPRLALKQAISLKPDAVFLLSDGEFPEGTVDQVAKLNTRKIPIHCIDLAGGLAGDHLKRIARGQRRAVCLAAGKPASRASLKDGQTMIDPRVASGLRDLTPAVMIPRERMLGMFRQVFSSFGFLPIETPHIERMEVLTGKGAGSDEVLRQIFEVTNKGGTPGELALRFDLTVPLARFVAKHIDELGVPFKRVCDRVGFSRRAAGQGPVSRIRPVRLRHDRHRERLADAETAQVIHAALAAAGVPEFTITLNNRKILDGFLELRRSFRPQRRRCSGPSTSWPRSAAAE